MNMDVGKYGYLLDNRGQIRSELVEDLLVEVIGGRLVFTSGSITLASRCASQGEIEQARIYYIKRLKECHHAGLMSRADLDAKAIESGAIDAEERARKEQLIEIRKRNLAARQKSTDPVQRVEIDAEVMKLNEEIAKLEEPEAEIYASSAEARADSSRISLLVCYCTTGGEFLNVLVWPTWSNFCDETNSQLVHDAREAYIRVSHGLPSGIIRSLARTPEWKMKWKSAQDSGSPIFDGSSTGWDYNKQSLVYWSDFYDSVARHPDAPSPEVAADDESLQSWLNLVSAQNRGGKKSGTTLYRRDGAGNRVPMTQMGSKNIAVRTPVRIRTPQRSQ